MAKGKVVGGEVKMQEAVVAPEVAAATPEVAAATPEVTPVPLVALPQAATHPVLADDQSNKDEVLMWAIKTLGSSRENKVAVVANLLKQTYGKEIVVSSRRLGDIRTTLGYPALGAKATAAPDTLQTYQEAKDFAKTHDMTVAMLLQLCQEMNDIGGSYDIADAITGAKEELAKRMEEMRKLQELSKDFE